MICVDNKMMSTLNYDPNDKMISTLKEDPIRQQFKQRSVMISGNNYLREETTKYIC